MDPAIVPDFEGRYLENEKRFFKNNFETVFWGPNSIIRNQLVKTLQLTFKGRFTRSASNHSLAHFFRQQLDVWTPIFDQFPAVFVCRMKIEHVPFSSN